MLLYHLDGIRINDSWYYKEGDTYHTFFLEYGEDEPVEGQWDRQRIGHMVSKDLKTWDYRGVALKPEAGIWNDKGLATGSVAKYGDLYYMLYTGNSHTVEREGIGLAVSKDLNTWERIVDAPVMPKYKLYPFKFGDATVWGCPLCDPYIYPEAICGNYYIFVNGWVADRQLNDRGAQLVFITKDFKSFTPSHVAVIGECDRMETAQVWERDGRFYMYSGRVFVTAPEEANVLSSEHFKMVTAQKTKNSIFSADNIDGTFTYRGDITFPEKPSSGSMYIAKVLPDTEGRDVMLVNNIPNGVMGVYPVTYNNDGTVSINAENI